MDFLKNKWLRVIVLTSVTILTNLLYLEEYRYNWRLFVGMCLAGIGLITLLWAGSVKWVTNIRRLYPSIQQTRKRILLTFSGYLIITLSVQVGIVGSIDLLDLSAFAPTSISYIKQICVGLFWILIIGSTYEVLYYLKLYREAVTESEAVHKTSLQRQYDHLKNQINPHFLFNSLNSLSSLIDENPKLANEFLYELSSVYRYLLQNHDYQLTTLKAEINFIKSYYFLLKSRFGNGIDINFAIDDTYHNSLIPPLSLQLLIENAITHHTIESSNPLKIAIRSTEDGNLLVSNNNQLKSQQPVATPDRITNIKARYRQIQLPEPIVTDHENTTTVWLPLLGKVSTQKYLYSKDGLV